MYSADSFRVFNPNSVYLVKNSLTVFLKMCITVPFRGFSQILFIWKEYFDIFLEYFIVLVSTVVPYLFKYWYEAK